MKAENLENLALLLPEYTSCKSDHTRKFLFFFLFNLLVQLCLKISQTSDLYSLPYIQQNGFDFSSHFIAFMWTTCTLKTQESKFYCHLKGWSIVNYIDDLCFYSV